MRAIFTAIFLAPGRAMNAYLVVVLATNAETDSDWWHRQF